MRIRRGGSNLLVLLLLIVSTLSGVAGAAGQRLTAPRLATRSAESLDLAAMSLSPADLDALGMSGFGIRTSAMLSLDEQAAQAARNENLGLTPDALRPLLEDAGFERRYQRTLALSLRPDDVSSPIQVQVTSYLIEYESIEGAAAGLALFEQESMGKGAQDFPPPLLADEAELTHLRSRGDGGRPLRALDLTFRTGNLVAGVTLSRFGGDEPEQSQVEMLGRRLLERIDEGRQYPGPGLSNLVLRLEGPGVTTRTDEYGRLAGMTYPNFGESPLDFAARFARYGDAEIVYGVGQIVASGSGSRTEDARSLLLLYQFANADEAATWVAGAQARALTVPNLQSALPVPDAASFGDESLTLAVTAKREGTKASAGYLITVRVAAQVAQVQVLGFPDLPLPAVEALAASQTACLVAGACPLRALPPGEIPQLMPATPFAPPARNETGTGSCGDGPRSTVAVASPIAPSTVPGDPLPALPNSEVPPNIVLILTDDLDARAVACMPHVQELLAAQGVSFRNAFVTTPLCCPSRSSILRGQYAHNHGVLNNSGVDGGFPTFYRRGNEDSTLATWLQDAGYRTALVGKYLNRYPQEASATHVPPGWNTWASFVSSDREDDEGGAYYNNFTLNQDGALVHYGNDPEDYSTDVLKGIGLDFIRDAAVGEEPFFLYLAPFAPHGPSTTAERHREAFARAEAPRVPSFAEQDVSDKPTWVQAHRALTDTDVALIDERYQRRLQSLLAVDAMVADVIETLGATGELENTYIVFASDNGYQLGEHRLPSGKQAAYDESTRVPLIVRGPGIPAGSVVDSLVLNIDWAPTFAKLAGANSPEFVDGRSFASFLTGAAPAEWRDQFLIERFERQRASGQSKPGVPATPVGGLSQSPESRIAPITAPPYLALRGDRYLYVEYANGERELYDVQADPYQLQNLAASADESLLATLSDDLARLRDCAAASCREADRSRD